VRHKDPIYGIEIFDDQQDEEKLLHYLKEVYEVGKNHEAIYSYFEPMGMEGRSFEQEMDLFLKRKKTSAGYQPRFSYPKVDKLNIAELVKIVRRLEDIGNEVKLEKGKRIKIAVLSVIENFIGKINILVEIKNGNFQKAFESAKIVYGDIDEDLHKEAEVWYKKRIDFLKEKKRKGILKSSLEKSLIDKKIDACGIKKCFAEAISQCNFSESGLKVVIDADASSIDVRFNDPRYEYPVILIPPSKRIDGMRLLELIAHEICGHVLLNYCNVALGLRGLILGRNWEVLQEGIALRNEVRMKRQILGNSYCDLRIKSNPYSILAMNKIKEGATASEVYDYIYELRKKVFMEMEYGELESSMRAATSAKMFFGRITRGVFPFYFPKDKAYFEGELLVMKMEKTITGTTRKTKLNPYYFPYTKYFRLAIASKLFADEKVSQIGSKMAKYILTE